MNSADQNCNPLLGTIADNDPALFWMKVDPAKMTTMMAGWEADCVGAYMLMRWAYWVSRNSLRDDDRLMARLTRLTPERFLELKPFLTADGTTEDGFWRYPEWDLAYQDAKQKHLRATANGRKGGQAAAETRRLRAITGAE